LPLPRLKRRFRSSRIHSEAEGVPATPVGPGPDQCFITDSNCGDWAVIFRK